MTGPGRSDLTQEKLPRASGVPSEKVTSNVHSPQWIRLEAQPPDVPALVKAVKPHRAVIGPGECRGERHVAVRVGMGFCVVQTRFTAVPMQRVSRDRGGGALLAPPTATKLGRPSPKSLVVPTRQ